MFKNIQKKFIKDAKEVAKEELKKIDLSDTNKDNGKAVASFSHIEFNLKEAIIRRVLNPDPRDIALVCMTAVALVAIHKGPKIVIID